MRYWLQRRNWRRRRGRPSPRARACTALCHPGEATHAISVGQQCAAWTLSRGVAVTQEKVACAQPFPRERACARSRWCARSSITAAREKTARRATGRFSFELVEVHRPVFLGIAIPIGGFLR